MTITFSPLPMKEAQAFWKDKVQLSPGQFAKLSDEAKLRAFAISQVARGDELATAYNALSSAIDSGISFGAFRKECKDIFARRGWTGIRAWRVDNIFRTNIQTAYNVGRYRQMARVAKTRPYWQYEAVNDSRTRPTHAALDGLVYPADSSFWSSWYPPNGYRCRCSVVSLTRRDVEAQGLSVQEDNPAGRMIEPIDPKTGHKMPLRPLMPDQGFDLNPGESFWGPMVQMLQGKAEAWPREIGAHVMREMAGSSVFEKWYAKPEGNWPIAVLNEESAGKIGAKTKSVLLSPETAAKQIRSHPDLKASEYAFVQQAISLGEQIQDGANSLIYILREDNGYVTVVKGTKSGKAVYMTSFRRLSTNEVKRDIEIQRLLAKKK